MSYFFKLAGAWVEIVGTTLLPGALEDENGASHDWVVSPDFLASFSPEWRAEKGFVECVEVARPVGVNVMAGVEDVAGVPTRTWTPQALSSDELAALIKSRRDQIDAYATRQVAALGPEWMQMHLICQAAALLDTQLNGTLTADQIAAQAALRTTLAWVLSVRDHATVLKAALPADGPGAAAFDITTGWPAPPA